MGLVECRSRSAACMTTSRRNDQCLGLQRRQLMSGGNSFLLWFRVVVEVTVDAEFNV